MKWTNAHSRLRVKYSSDRMNIWHSVVLICWFVSLVDDCYADDCYADESKPYKLFASKTSYSQVEKKKAKLIKEKHCKPVQLYLLVRHGTRYPDKDDIHEMSQILPILRDEIIKNKKLCDKDLKNLKNWRFNLTESLDETLHPEGAKELQNIGHRYKIRLPSLLSEPFSNDKYDVLFTGTERTESSARNFLIGVWEEEGKNIPLKFNPEADQLLRFHKGCKKWKKEVDKNPATVKEFEEFKSSKAMNKVLEKVSKRLGFKEHLSYANLSVIYDICRFESAWIPNGISPWCAAFKKKDLQVLEFAEDLKYYYKHGYAKAINYEQACPPIAELVHSFRNLTENPTTSQRLAQFRFSHSGAMLKIFTRLGFFNDSHPLTSNFKEEKNRKWRLSKFDSFSTNLGFVLFKCKDNKYKVSAFIEEKILKLPNCSDILCSFEEFLASYGSIADHCNLTQICSI